MATPIHVEFRHIMEWIRATSLTQKDVERAVIVPAYTELGSKIVDSANEEFTGPPFEYTGILHCHSTLSDGGKPIPHIAAIADSLGLDFLVMTDHETLAGMDFEGIYGRCRVLGGIGVIEMKEAVDMAGLQQFFVKHGVWIRPFGCLLYIMPPYIIEQQELRRLTSALVQAAS